MTRRQLSRHQREVRNQRIALIAVAVTLAVALLVPVYGYWKETYAIGGEPIAVVQGQPITTEFYARFLGFQEALVQHEAQRLANALAKATDDATKTSLQQQQQSLQQQASSQLTDDTLTYLVERPFVAAEAQKRGITASQADLDLALRQMMSGYPTYGIRYEGLSTIPDDKLESLDQAKAELTAMLAGGQFLTQDQVNGYVLTQRVLRSKLLAALSEGVPTSGEMVHGRHILVATQAEAQAARDRLVKGEDFAAVAKEVSTDTGSKDKGGDLGWFAKDQMVKEFSAAAFSLQVNEISQPVQSTYGYHIIQVLEKDPNRKFDQTYVDQLKATKYSDWISAQQATAGAVDMQNSADKTTWAQKFVTDRLNAAKK